MDAAARFRAQDYLVVSDFLADPLLYTSYRYAIRMALTRKLMADTQSDGSMSLYGDTLMDTLLEVALPTVSSLTGLELVPTYSFLRIYTEGNALPRHLDRDACEVTVSVCLGTEPDDRDAQPWPLYMQREGGGEPLSAICGPGDALVFRGRELAHWREPFAGDHRVLVFLHYVDHNGPFAGLVNDRRDMLGTPPVPRD